MRTLFDVIIFAAGFGACWFSKDSVVRLATGSEAFIRSLEAMIAELKGKI